jgi:RNase P subunit RPR2
MKQCRLCGEIKATTAFHRDRSKKDGRRNSCGVCESIRHQRSNAAHAEAKRLRDRAYRRTHPEIKHAQKVRELASPQGLARQACQDAVRLKKIVKPTVCEDCQHLFPKARLEGHHEDYAKPLAVRWLCHACHAKLHRKYTEAAVPAPAAAPPQEEL